uniref:Putative secreted protein n=1 Tax=Anopheles marajoara TaxID=58244 RepID=A0A2M4C5Y2_9DIPT
MLEPLELLRLAGAPRWMLLLAVPSGRFVGELLADNVDGPCSGLALASGVALFELALSGGTLRTVFVDTALLSEERDDRKLVRELLRSTSCERLALAIRPTSPPSVDGPVRRIEAVRRGSTARLPVALVPPLAANDVVDDDDGGTRSDRLRSRPEPFFTINRLAILGVERCPVLVTFPRLAKLDAVDRSLPDAAEDPPSVGLVVVVVVAIGLLFVSDP